MKMKTQLSNRILSLVLALVMVLGMLPMTNMTAFAAASDLTVTLDDGGLITLKDTDGDGYYEIGTAEKLLAFAAAVNNGSDSINAELTADIDLTDHEWTIIRATDLYYNTTTYTDEGYAGIFDGNGYTIKNISVKGVNGQKKSAGLFGTLSGTVKNLGIETFVFDLNGATDIRAGAIVGQIIGGTVSNCYVNGATIAPNSFVVGGIAGCVYAGTIENCYVVNSTISGTSGRFGYIVGDSRGDGGADDRPGTVTNCYADESAVNGTRTGNVTNCAYMSAERFASGVVAGLLGDAFGQNINNGMETQAYPVLGGATVYISSPCPRTISNSVIAGEIQHEGEGLCSVCGAVFYIKRSWDNTKVVSQTETVSGYEYTVVTSDITAWSGGGWYVVNGTVIIDGNVSVSGDVHLILTDGSSLTVNGDVSFGSGNSLTVYGQSGGTGELTVTGTGGVGNGANGTNGSSTGKQGGNGGKGGQGGSVTVHGGIVTVTGNVANGGQGGDGGQGWGNYDGGKGGQGGQGGSVTVHGGSVTVNGNVANGGTGGTGGKGGDGALGGQGGTGGQGGSVTVHGGSVTVNGNVANGGTGGTGGQGGSGSGAYYYYPRHGGKGGQGGQGGSVTVNGCSMSVTGSVVSGGSGGTGGQGGPGNYNSNNGSGGATGTRGSVIGIIYKDNVGTVYGNVTLNNDIEIPAGAPLTVPEGASLTVSEGASLTVPTDTILTVNGTLNNNGTVTNNGTLELTSASQLTGSGSITGDGACQIRGITDIAILVPSGLTYNGLDQTETAKKNISLEDKTIAVLQGKTFTYIDVNGYDTYTISPETVKNAGRYTVTYTNGTKSKSTTFTMAQKSVTLTWNGKAEYYCTGNEHTVTATYRDVDGQEQNATVTGGTNSAVGTYTATASIPDTNYAIDGSNTFGYEIKWYDLAPDATVTGTAGENGWYTSKVTLSAPGYTISGSLDGAYGERLEVSASINSVTYYLKQNGTGYIAQKIYTTPIKIDDTLPLGDVTITDAETSDVLGNWDAFSYNDSIYLFVKDAVTVTATADDDNSGVAKIAYASSDKAMPLDAVEAITEWTEYTGKIDVALEDAKRFVYFVRITDNAGNATYLSTGVMEYDTTAPVISGVENGNIYYTTQKVTVTEKNVKSITVNGEPATKEITLDGNVAKTYTIIVEDYVGYKASVTVTMKPISELSEPIDELTKDNVTSGDEGTVDGVKAVVEAVDTTNATDTEKQALKDIADKAAELKKVIDDTEAEITRINEELNEYSDATVNSDDAAALEQLSKDIKALTDGNNLTDAERTALTKTATEVAQLQKIIEDTAAKNKRISDEVDGYDLATVTSDDQDDLEQLLADIEKQLESTNLTDDEISELNGDKTAVEDLLAMLKGTDELIDKLTGDVDKFEPDTVKSTDKGTLEQIIKDIDTLLEGDNLTDTEREDLKEVKQAVQELLDTVNDTADGIKAVKDTVGGLDEDSVKSTDKGTLEQIIKDIDALLDTGNLTEDEKKALEDAKEKAKALLDTIEDAATAPDTENTQKVEDVTVKNVTPDDKIDLEKAKDDLEKALEDYGSNMTEDEKKTIEDKIKRIEDALEVIGNVEAVEELIDKLPENITKNDEAAIKAAVDAYNALSDYEKSLVGEDAKKALDDAKAALAELNKPENSNIWLWFALLFIIGGAVITLTVVDRKRKAVKR